MYKRQDIAWYVLFVVVYLSIVVFVVFTEGAIRKIPVNYASSTSVTMRAREQTHMPVSYTHLDVYKRQEHGSKSSS